MLPDGLRASPRHCPGPGPTRGGDDGGMTASSGDIEVTLHDGWAEVRLNRPNKRNALSWAMAEELVAVLNEIKTSGRAAAVLAANWPVFCAGGALEDQKAGRP